MANDRWQVTHGRRISDHYWSLITGHWPLNPLATNRPLCGEPPLPEPAAAHVLAVLFDLDGTLLDTLEDIGRSANETLEELGFASHPIAAYRQFIGDGIAMLFRRALPVGVDAAIIDRCVGGFRQTYGRGWNIATRPYPGIPELLDELTARSLGLAILSNKPDAFVQQCASEYLAALAVPVGSWRSCRRSAQARPDRSPPRGRPARRSARGDPLPRRFVHRHDHRSSGRHDAGGRSLGISNRPRVIRRAVRPGSLTIRSICLVCLIIQEFSHETGIPRHWPRRSCSCSRLKVVPPNFRSRSGSTRHSPTVSCGPPGGSSVMMNRIILI